MSENRFSLHLSIDKQVPCVLMQIGELCLFLGAQDEHKKSKDNGPHVHGSLIMRNNTWTNLKLLTNAFKTIDQTFSDVPFLVKSAGSAPMQVMKKGFSRDPNMNWQAVM